MALARGAALALTNAPLFAASTDSLACCAGQCTGEVNPRVLSPTDLDVCAHADTGKIFWPYSALYDDQTVQRRGTLILAGSAVAGIAAIRVVAGGDFIVV